MKFRSSRAIRLIPPLFLLLSFAASVPAEPAERGEGTTPALERAQSEFVRDAHARLLEAFAGSDDASLPEADAALLCEAMCARFERGELTPAIDCRAACGAPSRPTSPPPFGPTPSPRVR